MEVAVEVGIDLGGVHAQLQLSPRRRPDAAVLYARLVDALVEIGRRTPLLVIFDEFQSIDTVTGAAAVLRTALQHHYGSMGLVFAGSAPSAMRQVFTRHDQPFFDQADLLTIGPLLPAAVHRLVADGFAATGRDPGTVAGDIVRLTGGHPQRTMRAADEVWRHARTDPAHGVWGRALLALREAEQATLPATYADLPGDQQKLLRLHAADEPPFGAAAQRLQLSPGGATHARDRLLADGKLRTGDDDQVVITDPLLADWLPIRLPL